MISPSGPIRVLHVDDDPELADVAATFLEREDERIDCRIESSASDGLDHLDTRPVDCVVSDYDMPGRNGIEFLRSVREEYGDLPFILYTGKGSEEVASDAISAGVTDYLQKGSGTEDYELLANRIVDAVAQVRTERKLGDTERWLEMILDATKTGIWEWNLESDDLEWNEAMERSLGLDPGTFEGTYEAFERRVHPVDVPRVETAVERAIANDELFQLEFRKLHEDGHVIWTNGRGRILRDRRGADRMVGIHHDITERKRRERVRREEDEAVIDRALERFDQPLFVLAPDGDLRRWNERLPAVTGHVDGDLAAMPATDLVPVRDRERLATGFEEALATGHRTVGAALRTADGELLPHEFTGARLVDEADEPTCLVVVARPTAEAEATPLDEVEPRLG